ncbi:G-protein coupled receptor moody-like [Penaeus monodon]|uniref:G-protein coupled receptor moody-like n=1 Tax=Penaeus monodon TaxID=6687 RepID=UPI0018A761C5|nr:G-protein coupled receptor moody-like [Penaeus monodon]
MEGLATQAVSQFADTNGTTNDHNSTGQVETWSLVLGMIVTLTVMVIGSLGNLLTLLTFAHQFCMPIQLRCIKYMTPDTVLILNLALADFLYSAVNLPFMFNTYYSIYMTNSNISGKSTAPWENNMAACSFSAFLRYTNAFSEWMTLGLMALERCICIHKFRHNSRRPNKWFTCWKTFIYCIMIWMLGMALQIPTYVGAYGNFGYNNMTLKCDFIDTNGANPRILFFTMETAIPCILIFIGNKFILVLVYSNNRRILSVMGSHAFQQAQLRRSRTTRVIVRLLIVFLVCVIPICLYNVIFARDNVSLHETVPEIGIVLYCIYFLQYCINNFIYVVCFEKYRCAYYQFLCFILCRKVKPVTPVKTLPLRPSDQVYTISSPHGLQVPEKMLPRTPSECEEERRAENDPQYQQWQRNSPNSSLSSQASFGLEIPESRLASSLRSQGESVTFESDVPDRRHTFGSLSTCSSNATLVLPAARKFSLKKKLKRTFSR